MHPEGADMPIDPVVMTLVSDLARYWRQHPDACDTPTGIARWWIDVDRQPLTVAQVEGALGWMAARGVVRTVRAADGRVLYRRASAGADLDATLDALAQDWQAASGMPPTAPPEDR
jgi:hypothetical protein